MASDSVGIFVVAQVAVRIFDPPTCQLNIFIRVGCAWLMCTPWLRIRLEIVCGPSGGENLWSEIILIGPFYQSWLWLINLFTMTSDSIRIVVLANVAVRIFGPRATQFTYLSNWLWLLNYPILFVRLWFLLWPGLTVTIFARTFFNWFFVIRGGFN